MALPERAALAFEGVVVAAVDVFRAAPGGRGAPPAGGTLRCRLRITTRGMWLDKGKLLDALSQVRFKAVGRVLQHACCTAFKQAPSRTIYKSRDPLLTHCLLS